MLDRVAERRRAAQLARHYRDQEGLSIAEIARRLGRAEATIKTYIANAAIPARLRANGHGNGFARRCAHGERATALRRPPTTGRAPTRAGAAANRSNDCRSENGQRRPLSSICTGVGRRPSPTPSAAPERLGVNAVDIRTRACAWPSVTGAPRVAANACPIRAIHSPFAPAADFCSDLLRRLRAGASALSKQTADSATTAPFRRERKPLRPIPDLIGLSRVGEGGQVAVGGAAPKTE